MNPQDDNISLVLKALSFSAEKHRNQRRKGAEAVPYINHPINVARILRETGGVREIAVIVAAILHDTVEDTETTFAEIEEHFGSVVRNFVAEVTDDKSLPKLERKRLQIEHAPRLSAGAKQIKLADKISNIEDVAFSPPADWSRQTRMEYLTWADDVVNGLRGCNQEMERCYDAAMDRARKHLG